MAARSLWNAELHVGDAVVPVKLYAAVEDRNIHFHLLHDQDFTRVRQRMAHSETNETVPIAEARRGYQVDSDTIVMLDAEELDSLKPDPSRAIRVEAFLPRQAINHQWYDRPYYLGPNGNEKQYFSLVESVARSDREGVARWVMRGKQYVGALASRNGYLLLVTLRHEGEVIEADNLSAPTGRDLPAKERNLAEQLVQALADDFDLSKYHDEYREQVAALLEAKARGEEIEIEDYQEPAENDSFSASLEASLQALQR